MLGSFSTVDAVLRLVRPATKDQFKNVPFILGCFNQIVDLGVDKLKDALLRGLLVVAERVSGFKLDWAAG